MEFSKEIRDPVHGWIRLTREEARLIDDSMYLQRLRYVSQLGLVYLTYPTAKYTRFDHSLGTMHLAHRIAEEALGKMDERRLEEVRESMGLHDDGVDQLLEHVRLAALHHDVGHLPLSHTLEGILSRNYRAAGCGVELSERLFNSMKEHEAAGFLVTMGGDFRKIMESAVGGVNVDAVRSLAFPSPDGRPPLLHSIISSSLDADRMDYVLRDIYFTGAGVGTNALDVERLVQYVYLDGEELLFDEKAKAFLEGFAIARYNSYKWVYFHHKPLLFTKIARDLLAKLIGRHDYPCLLLRFIAGRIGNTLELFKVTDDYFTSLLPDLAERLPEAGMLLSRRTPYKPLWKRDNDYLEALGGRAAWLNDALDELRAGGVDPETAVEEGLSDRLGCGGDCVKVIIPRFDKSFKSLMRGRTGTVTTIWDSSPLVRAIDESWRHSPHAFIYVNEECGCDRAAVVNGLLETVEELRGRRSGDN